MTALLKGRGYKAGYDLIGGDALQAPRHPELVCLCQRLVLAANVVFHGQMKTVEAALSRLNVGVCTLYEYAWSMSMLVATSRHKAIVSTDVNGITEVLTRQLNAIFVDSNELEAREASPASLLDTKALAENTGWAARLTLLEHFSERAFGTKTALHSSLLEEGSRAEVQ